MRRSLVIILVLLLLVTIAAALLWRTTRKGEPAERPEVHIHVGLSAPQGQPMARGAAIFLNASLRGRSRPVAGRASSRSDERPAQEAQARLGSARRPWWQDLRLLRVGEVENEVAFAVVPGSPQPYVVVGTGDVGHVQLLLGADHDLPAGPVTLQASWQAGEAEVRSRPLTVDVSSDSRASTRAVMNARYHLEVGDLRAATEILEEALESQPRNATLHSLRGRVLERSGDLEAAAAAYGRAVDLAMERLPADAQEPPTLFIGQLRRVRAKLAGNRANR